MDSFEWNKVFGAVLATVLVIAGLNVVIGKWMTPHKSEKPGMTVEVAETPTGDGGTQVAEAAPDWGTVLPAADLTAGEKTHQRCLQCHDFGKGGPNKIGPNLYGIVGNKHASNATFAYSPAMAALNGKTWGYDELNEFIKNPKGAVTGTKMAFAGLSKTQERVNLIAYLRTLSDSPLAIPAPNPAASPAAPAGGATEAPAGDVQTPPAGEAPAGATPAPAGAAPAPAGAAPAAAGTTPAAPATEPAPAPATPPAH